MIGPYKFETVGVEPSFRTNKKNYSKSNTNYKATMTHDIIGLRDSSTAALLEQKTLTYDDYKTKQEK